MRSRVRNTGVLILFAVVLLLVQASIQLLHLHFDDSYHDHQDGFHALCTLVTCPATTSLADTHSDSPSLIPAPSVYPIPRIICTDLIETDIKPLLSTISPSGPGSRASPV
jgi:hypothetical protein